MPGQVFDPSLYPRTYRISTGWQIFLMLIGLGLLAGGFFLVSKYFDNPSSKDAMAFAIIGPVLLLIALYVIGDTMLSKVILSPDAIEVHDLMPMRRMERADIKGRRLFDSGQAGGKAIIFIPKEADKKKLKLPMIVQTDDAMKHWIETLPDLDAEGQAEAMQEILSDLGESATKEERLAALAAAKKTAKSIKTTTIIALIAGYFLPGYYPIAILLGILPWWALILAARGPGLYTLNDHKNDPRAGLGTAFILPGMILMVSALLDYHLVDWTPVHLAAIAIAMLVTFLACNVDKQLIKKKTAFIVLPLMIPYGYGALITGNALADRSPAEKFETHVVNKHYTSGKGAHPELKIESWSNQPGGDVAVSGALYKLVDSGSTVCVYEHKGALNMPWYYVDLCSLK